MDIDQLVESLEFRFNASGVDNAKRVTEELLAYIFRCKPLEIYTGGADGIITPVQQFEVIRQLEPLAKRIENGEPLQYVLGSAEFWGLEIKCDSRALIPRPETELLVEEVLSCRIMTDKRPATVADVGTGTGCIAITLAKQRPDAAIKAVDLSTDALELAQENAERHGVQQQILWMQNNLLERFAPESTDVVVANLPYISSGDWKMLSGSVREHEPKMALDAGPSGMELIRDLALQARSVLVPEGMLFLEFGFDQGEAVFHCLNQLGYRNIQIKHDLAGHPRIAIAVNP
ncbi:peptide chain release factor N(5)-glutamine methyltransferase [Pontiella agarivorans]|uniref:Release factor glutamine methyltransferase n=1 Tax=Pontiella agarivorans TaxID=3038953 RepID=A0ABU5MZM8_9BACT|nr:peptide chain release factor N(5)-glutamine methyltransferase [Pontiella agarivorans]MDZ8119664.1 peptide chain release factor N(5)-glutamine methyltransferase [Pontiella agarivorans]